MTIKDFRDKDLSNLSRAICLVEDRHLQVLYTGTADAMPSHLMEADITCFSINAFDSADPKHRNVIEFIIDEPFIYTK